MIIGLSGPICERLSIMVQFGHKREALHIRTFTLGTLNTNILTDAITGMLKLYTIIQTSEITNTNSLLMDTIRNE